jgi:hypothetical protein
VYTGGNEYPVPLIMRIYCNSIGNKEELSEQWKCEIQAMENILRDVCKR